MRDADKVAPVSDDLFDDGLGRTAVTACSCDPLGRLGGPVRTVDGVNPVLKMYKEFELGTIFAAVK